MNNQQPGLPANILPQLSQNVTDLYRGMSSNVAAAAAVQNPYSPFVHTPTNPYFLANIFSTATHAQTTFPGNIYGGVLSPNVYLSHPPVNYIETKPCAGIAAQHYSPVMAQGLATRINPSMAFNGAFNSAFVYPQQLTHQHHNQSGQDSNSYINLVGAAMELQQQKPPPRFDDVQLLTSPPSNKSSLSGGSADVKSLDRSPFALPSGGPGSHSEAALNNSPSAGSCQTAATPSPAASISRHPQRLQKPSSICSSVAAGSAGNGSSLNVSSPMGSLASPPSTSSLRLVNESPLPSLPSSIPVFPRASAASQHLETVNAVIPSTSFTALLNSEYATCGGPTPLHSGRNSSLGSTAGSNADRVILTSASQFDPGEIEQGSIFTNNVDLSLATAAEDPFSVLGKEVNLDLVDSIGGSNVVNHQFWEDLGDSVLDDALLGHSAGADDSTLPGTSLLHSVFEFTNLHNSAFEDMVQSSEMVPGCSFAAPESSPLLSATSVASTSGSTLDGGALIIGPSPGVVDSSVAVAAIPKFKEKSATKQQSSTKEREFAEIDRAFDRHFNAIAQKNEQQRDSSIISSANVQGQPRNGSASYDFQWNNTCSIDSLTSDLTFTGLAAAADQNQKILSTLSSHVIQQQPVHCEPIIATSRFSPVIFEADEPDANHSSLAASFPNVGKFFLPPSGTSSQFLQSGGDYDADNSTSTKWTPRKSKRVPIYKQQTPTVVCGGGTVGGDPSAVHRLTGTTAKKSAAADSPYCFTDEDESNISATTTAEPQQNRKKADAKEYTGNAERTRNCHSAKRSAHAVVPMEISGGGINADGVGRTLIDEKKLEEEVKRKLLQISTLHPELRLGGQNCGKFANVNSASSSSTHKNTSQSGTNSSKSINRHNHQVAKLNIKDPEQSGATITTNDDMLRHMVPKKRLSASARNPNNYNNCNGNKFLLISDECTTTDVKKSALVSADFCAISSASSLNLHPHLSSSCSSGTSTFTVLRLPTPRGTSSNEMMAAVPKVESFVKTEIIADTETAKPYMYDKSLNSSSCSSIQLNQNHSFIRGHSSDASVGTISSTNMVVEPLKPKLIIRIPKQCLINVSGGTPLDFDHNLNNNSRKKRSKHKHKKKRKKSKEFYTCSCANINNNDNKECNCKDKRRRKTRDHTASGLSAANETGVLNSPFNTRNQAYISSDSDDCHSSASVDEIAETSSGNKLTDPSIKISSDHHSSFSSSKNRKKMRWLHSNDEGGTSSLATTTVSYSQLDTSQLSNGISTDFMKKPPPSQTAIFQKGAFVVCKADLSNHDCPLWRVDSQNLLQKFLPVDKDGRVYYQGSSTYAGWCERNQDEFVAVQVKYLPLTRTRNDCVVELEHPLIELFPAVSTEIKDSIDVDNFYVKTENCNTTAALDALAHPLKEALQTYLHILILHCVLGNYLQSLKLRNESELLAPLNEIDYVNREKRKKLTKDSNWSPKFEEALEWYPYCMVNEDDGSGLHCQACGRNVVENTLQLFANEGYDFETLVPLPPKTTASGSPLPSQDFHVCPSCADVAVLYHKLAHMRYHLYKQCAEKVDIIRGDNTCMAATVIVENCLRHKSWILSALQEYLNIWSKIG